MAPTARPTALSYNPTANKITITSGTTNFDFQNMAANATDDIKNYLDWTKFEWIVDEQNSGGTSYKLNDASGSDVTKPNTTYVSTAYVTSDTTLEITLTSAGGTYLEGLTGFGNLGGDGTFGGGADGAKITEGFIKDKAGNSANLDGSVDSDGAATVDTTNDYVLFSTATAFSEENSNNTALTYGGTNTCLLYTSPSPRD